MTTPSDQSGDAPLVAVRPAGRDDLAAVAALIHPLVEQGILLPRTEAELADLLKTGFVADAAGEIVGFAALEIYSPKLAELRSLAVAEGWRGRGIGKRLVAACVELARQKNILEVMTITAEEDFFRTCGFDFTLPGQKKALFIHTGGSTTGPTDSTSEQPNHAS